MENVIVSVVGIQRDAYQEENCIEQEMVGYCSRNDRMTVIRYEEKDLAAGEAGTETQLQVLQDKVVLLRRGGVEHRMEFRSDAVTHGIYQSPYGQFRTSVRTSRLEVIAGMGTIAVDIQYELEIDGQWQSENRLSINVRGLKNRGH